MSTKNLEAQDAIHGPIPIDSGRGMIAAISTGSTNDAGADVVLEIEGISGEWIGVGLLDGSAQDAVESLTGVSRYGWAVVPGVKNIRVRRTDANGGICNIGLELSEA